jgi:hypothetical protein
MRIVMRLIVMSFTLIALGAMPSMAHAQGDKGKSKIAEEAFIYGFPMVMNYAVFYDTSSTNPPRRTRLRSIRSITRREFIHRRTRQS